jgi:hypothetical protein
MTLLTFVFQRSLEYNSRPNYRELYEKELQEIRDLEIWRAGKAVRYVPTFPLHRAYTNTIQFSPPREPEVSKQYLGHGGYGRLELSGIWRMLYHTFIGYSVSVWHEKKVIS